VSLCSFMGAITNKFLLHSRLTGIFCLLLGIGGNKFILEALLAGDGKISDLAVNLAILILQGFFLIAGIFYLKRAYKQLARLGIAFLLLVALQFWIRMLLEVPFPEKRMFATLPKVSSLFETGLNYQDQISRYEARFDELKTLLPSTGSVGYVTSEHLPSGEAKLHYGLTTYTLSPLHIERTASHTFIIGNFPNIEAGDIPLFENLILVKNFGNGVMLFTRKDAS
jgi:hypothetical protein